MYQVWLNHWRKKIEALFYCNIVRKRTVLLVLLWVLTTLSWQLVGGLCLLNYTLSRQKHNVCALGRCVHHVMIMWQSLHIPQAHIGPTVTMAFDPSSTLLATGKHITTNASNIRLSSISTFIYFPMQALLMVVWKFGIVKSTIAHTTSVEWVGQWVWSLSTPRTYSCTQLQQITVFECGSFRLAGRLEELLVISVSILIGADVCIRWEVMWALSHPWPSQVTSSSGEHKWLCFYQKWALLVASFEDS